MGLIPTRLKDGEERGDATMTDSNGVHTDIAWIKNTLTEMKKWHKDHDDKHESIQRELGALSVKATFMGAIAGLVGGGTFGLIIKFWG
jgi:hypothetical protein